jgi:outer membrane protein TolC
MILLVAAAAALTLAEAVERAAVVNPDATIAALRARQAQLDAGRAWSGLGLTPSLSAQRSWAGGASVASSSVSVAVGALDATRWFDAAEKGSDAQAARYAARGSALDAQYAAAQLFVAAVQAERARDAAALTEQTAGEIAEAVNGRVAAGIDSDLLGKSAQAAHLVARAEHARAEARVRQSRLLLQRALEFDELGALEPPAALELPAEPQRSPWLEVASAELQSARWSHWEAAAGWLPRGGLAASSALDPMSWTITLSGTWTLGGVVGPFLKERHRALGVQIAETAYEGLKRDLATAEAVAADAAAAALAVQEAQAARRALAEAALAAGQARVKAGISATLELLRLQDDVASARADLVAAELEAQTATLEARRVAALPW